LTVPCPVTSGKDIAKPIRDRAGHCGLLPITIWKWKSTGELAALLIDVHDKEENHGDYTTAWQTAGYH